MIAQQIVLIIALYTQFKIKPTMLRHLHLYLSSIVLAVFSVVAIAAPQAQLQVSRISGTAPLAVHFDAIGTTDSSVSDPFRELIYNFNFGDPSSGTWKHSGLSKNTQSGGPLAAHVYDNPGTYTARLTVGNDIKQVTITVQNPNAVFSGTKTVCLSRNSDMTGCPSGAQQISNISAWPNIENSKRYMLHAGHNFSSLGALQTEQIHNTQITRFSNGNNPIIGALAFQRTTRGYPDNSPSDWVSNVQVIGLSAFSISHNITGNNLLFYKNNIHSGGENTGIFFAHGYGYYKDNNLYPSSMVMPMNIFVVENTSTVGPAGDHTGLGQMIWMGNELTNTKAHNMRLWQSYKTFIAHNKWGGNSDRAGKGNVKIHAEGFDPVIVSALVPSNHKSRTQYVVIADNIVNSTSSRNVWVTLSIKPQDSIQNEGVESVIMERNTHVNGSQPTTAGAFAGRNIITRNEIFVGHLSPPSVNHYGESLPQQWQGPYFIDNSLF